MKDLKTINLNIAEIFQRLNKSFDDNIKLQKENKRYRERYFYYKNQAELFNKNLENAKKFAKGINTKYQNSKIRNQGLKNQIIELEEKLAKYEN